MSKIRTLLAGTVIAATAVLAAPGIAQAAPCTTGEFCAWADGEGELHAQGNTADWPDNVQNKVDEVQNSGTSGGRDDVNIYYNESYSSAYACLPRGETWNLRDGSKIFSWVSNQVPENVRYAGWNAGVHDNAASHKWVTDCGPNT